MKMRNTALFLSLLIIASQRILSQPLKAIEFKNQEMRDILFALAGLSGASVLPDDTVTGKTSFYFSNMDYAAAIRLFLESNNLFSWTREGIIYVSRIRVRQDEATKLVSVECRDAPITSLIQAISNTVSKTILYDQLPQDQISLRVSALELQEILSIIVAKFPDLWIDSKGTFLYIRKKDINAQNSIDPGSGYFTREGDLFSIEVDRASARNLILDLFKKADKEVVFLIDQDTTIENLSLHKRTFEESLQLLLFKNGGDFSASNGIYYIIDAQKKMYKTGS